MLFFVQNPLMLLGLLATAVPILLHLQKRRSAKTVRFPSLELLNSIHRKKRFSLKLREILLLILRTLLILFLVLALSGVQWERKGKITPQSLYGQFVPKEILLIDTSYSMGYREGDKSQLQRTVEAAEIFLDQSRAGQSFLVLPFADGIDPMTLQTASFETDLEKIRQQLRSLSPTGEKTNVLKTMKQLSEVFDDTYQNRIWVFTDLQESGWNEVVRFASNDKTLFRNLPDTIILPVASEEHQNFYLRREPSPSGLPRVLGEPFPLMVTAASLGFNENQQVPLTMSVEGKVLFDDGSSLPCSVYDKRTRLVGNDAQELAVPLVPLGNLSADIVSETDSNIDFATWEGSASLEVETDEGNLDRLIYDNTVTWKAPVLWNLPVLLVETSSPEIATRVMEVCLDPYGGQEPFFLNSESISSSAVALDILHRFPVVVLQEDAWGELDESGRRTLLRYVREGGCLIAFATGDEDADLLDACGVQMHRAIDLKEPLVLASRKSSDPVTTSLSAFLGEDLSPIYIYDAVQLDQLDRPWLDAESSNPSSLARIHFPVMGEKKYGKGTCVFLGTGLNGDRSDLASSVLFLPLIHQTLKYLVMHKVPQTEGGFTPEGKRIESNLRTLSDVATEQLTTETGLIVLRENATMVGRRKTDLAVPLLWLVLVLALAEVWIGNRKL